MTDFTLETSPSTAALDDALAKAQGQIKNASKDSLNPHFKSKYADLASIWEACKEALVKNQIAVTQWPIASDDSKQHLITRLAHKGEWMQARISIPMDKQNAHGVGSAITYAKRYSLAAALGVADEDDDGNAAIKSPAKRQTEAYAAEAVADGLAKDTTSTYDATKETKAKEYADSAIEVMNLTHNPAGVKDWRRLASKVPEGKRKSPLEWLKDNSPGQYLRVRQAYQNATSEDLE